MNSDSSLHLRILQELDRRFSTPINHIQPRYEPKVEVKTTEKKYADSIREAVMGVFSKFPNTNVNMPTLVSMAVQSMGTTPDRYTLLSNQVSDFIRAEAELGNMSIKRGRGGGVSLVKKG